MKNDGLVNEQELKEIENAECLNKEDMTEVEVLDVAFSYGEHRIRND